MREVGFIYFVNNAASSEKKWSPNCMYGVRAFDRVRTVQVRSRKHFYLELH